MTDKLYWLDSYVKVFDARIVRAAGNLLVLDRSAFYPAGGGQPNDRGRLTINGVDYSVIDLKKEGEDIVHVLDREAAAKPGDAVKGAIDWDYRYACMRYHTALHTIDGILETVYKSGSITGGQIYPDRARIDVDMPDASKDKITEVLERTNTFAKEGHNISIREISADEAARTSNLSRTEPGRELLKKLKTVRVVEIEGLDVQADGGTHVRNTREIGRIVLSNYENKGAKRKRIEIILE